MNPKDGKTISTDKIKTIAGALCVTAPLYL
jgi:hypothetical protein